MLEDRPWNEATWAELEAAADEILAPYLKDKRKNKNRVQEYPILSKYQLKRIRSQELPISNLSKKQMDNLERKQVEGPGR